MTIALVHDYIKEYGGAERVLESLHALYPDAEVFTTVYLPDYLGPHRKRFENWKIHTSVAQYLPFKAKLISPLRLIAPFLFKSFDFSSFDVVIVSATGAYSPNGINKKSALQFCYCHTPPRYLYGYATAREWKKNIIFRVFGEVANHFLRIVDFKSSQNVDYFIANSQEVASRIKKFYRRDARVIFPSVDIKNQEFGIRNHGENEYFLAGGRLARAKHIDLIIKVCKENKLPLKIFGKGFAGYENDLKKLIKNSDIEMVGEVSDTEKVELMRNAKAYIFAGEDEDFGITPIESMSVGTPVIAYKSGGVKETVLSGKTGIFFDELTPESLENALHTFNKASISSKICIKHAQQFSQDVFKNSIKEFVTSKASH